MLWWLVGHTWVGCPFQNPFWSVEKPLVVPVMDEASRPMPNRVNNMWRQLENFKCVDFR